jgi:hypothetical protein
MIRKLFALASVTALGGFVATIGATGCSSTDKVTSSGDAGPGGRADVKNTDAQKPPPAGDGGKDTSPTCKADIQFTPDATKPPAPQQQSACTAAAIDALADACIADATSKDCTDARAAAANKTCAECIFGTKADEEWKPIVLAPGEKPSAIYNQEGCVDHLTGVKGCGHKYVTVLSCFNAYCGNCDATSVRDCVEDIAEGECKSHRISDETCAKALSANELTVDRCFPASEDQAGVKALFVHMATVACASSLLKDGG